MALLAILCTVSDPMQAAVPNADITLQPVVTDNLPVFTSLTAYNYTDSEAVSTVLGGTTVLYDAPLFYPFDSSTPGWWDNLVADLLQARLPVAMFATRGTQTTDPNDLSGGLNPRQLSQMTAALQRAGATNLLKIACFVDTPSLEGIYTSFHGLPGGTVMDMSVSSDWNDIFWLRGVKPWFDTVPSQYWYKVNNRPVIQWWSIAQKWFSNQNGNTSKLLQSISDSFNNAYGVRPVFIIDQTWESLDSTALTQPDVIGVNDWFGPPSKSYTYTALGSFISGTAVAGFINPGYFDPTSSNYHNANMVIPRNKIDGSGANGDTLISGLDAAVTAISTFTVLEGFNDVREWAGLYRSAAAAWNTPGQYINLIRRYCDLRTVTLRLEAEACDEYYDTTTGNSSGEVDRRSGNLDIRALTGSGWAVTNTAAGEWVQFDSIDFSPGNYRFAIRYATTTANSRMRLYVDGVALPDVPLPATTSMNTFDTISLGQKTIGWGTHTLRVMFVDGGVDLDWLFVKKVDPMLTIKSTLNSFYVTAERGGNNVIIANRTAIGGWEQFSADDMNGATLAANDVINLQAHDGLLLSAEGGGGGQLSVNRRRAGSWEQFTVIKLNGSGTLENGDSIALRTVNGQYLTVTASGQVDCSGTAIGAAQTFSVTLGTQ
jgi:hypothetical protein